MTRSEEIAVKERRLRDLMRERGFDAALLKTKANFSWFTAGGINEVTISDALGVSSILVTDRGRFVISNRIEAPRMMEDEGLSDLGFSLILHEWFEGGERAEVSRLLDPSKVACDIPALGYGCLSEEIAELRHVLLEPEVERYLWLGQKTSLAVESVLAGARPGMKESALIGEVLRILWYDRIDSICNQAAADERSRKYRHAIPTEKCLAKYLTLNVNARKWGLVTTITRAIHVGPLPAGLRAQYESTVWIENNMIEATKPGVATGEIFAKAKRCYAEKGLPDEWRLHHQGGAQGYQNRDYLVLPSDERRVREGQCFCWNPTIAGPEFGTKSEDAFIARKEGPQFITKAVLFPTIRMAVGQSTFVRPAIMEL
jgi:Xaa-Pro dipeptidase